MERQNNAEFKIRLHSESGGGGGGAKVVMHGMPQISDHL